MRFISSFLTSINYIITFKNPSLRFFLSSNFQLDFNKPRVIDKERNQNSFKGKSTVSSYNIPWSYRRDRGIQLYSFFNLGDRWCGWSTPPPGRFITGNNSVLIVQEAVWIPDLSGLTHNISPPPRFDLQPEATCYTDYTIPALGTKIGHVT
jgi:hypothetical protein